MKRINACSIAIVFIIPSLAFAQIEQWVYRYDGSWSDQDIAYALAYGLDGNIYTVGKTVSMGTGTDLIMVSLKDNGDKGGQEKVNDPIH